MKTYSQIFLFCAVLTALSASGQGRTMIVTDRASQQTPIQVTPQTRISFSDDLSKMIVSPGSEASPLTVDVGDIANIVFTLDSGVDQTLPETDGLEISNRSGIITISSPMGFEYSAWDAAGHLILSGHGEETAVLDFTEKAHGVYIIRVNNTTFKFVNR